MLPESVAAMVMALDGILFIIIVGGICLWKCYISFISWIDFVVANSFRYAKFSSFEFNSLVIRVAKWTFTIESGARKIMFQTSNDVTNQNDAWMRIEKDAFIEISHAKYVNFRVGNREKK